jgi:hypothetical protein
MHPLISTALVLFGLFYAFGFACLLLPPKMRSPLLAAATSMGLSLGGLTLILFWRAMLLPGRLGLTGPLLTCTAVSVVGLVLAKRRDSLPALSPVRVWKPLLTNPFVAALMVATGLIVVGILVNATYWPFSDWDALVIYAPFAKHIFEHGTLPADSVYAGYPMLLPLAFAYTHWVTGMASEHWARLVPALTAIGGIAGAALFAREAGGRKAAWFAAGITSLTPLYGRWAGSGYTDVTVGFYVVMCSFFAWRYQRTAAWRDAVLTGLFAGCALWTKNDGLTLLVSLTLLVFFPLSEPPGAGRSRRWRLRVRAGLWMGIPMLLVAAPWYARNVIRLGTLIPPTIWLNHAQPSLANAAIFIRPHAELGVPGWLFFASILFSVGMTVAGNWRKSSVWFVLLAFVIPFFLAWWALASYDVRFLVTLVPSLSVLAAVTLNEVLAHLRRATTRQLRAIASWSGAILVLLLIPSALGKTVKHADVILNSPSMNESEKHRILLGGIFDIAEAINGLPRGSNVIGVPQMALYHIDTARLGRVSLELSDRPPWDLAPEVDYLVLDLDGGALPEWGEQVQPLVQTPDGYLLYPTSPVPSTRDASVQR